MNYPVAAVSVGFLVTGVLFILFPGVIRKYDERLTRFVRDEREYSVLLTVFGILFLVAAIGAGVFAFFGTVN